SSQLNRPQEAELPVSACIIVAKSSLRRAIKSAVRFRMSARVCGLVADQAGKAAAAALAASAAASGLAAAARVTLTSETGLRRSNTAPSSASMHTPRMMSFASYTAPLTARAGPPVGLGPSRQQIKLDSPKECQ